MIVNALAIHKGFIRVAITNPHMPIILQISMGNLGTMRATLMNLEPSYLDPGYQDQQQAPLYPPAPSA